MLSIVFYGRNNNDGNNLVMRAAISLNCMAAALSSMEDEILFVDYNTPEHLPTFPEAIATTLTEQARQRLRILRVRADEHAQYGARTHLPTFEPVARNIAIRRSHPGNRWVLSTGENMIFVPRAGQLLTSVAADLLWNFFVIPRFEIPERVWEGYNPDDPQGVLQQVTLWRGSDSAMDATLTDRAMLGDGQIHESGTPGYVQLVKRSDLFAIQGFNETLLGQQLHNNLIQRLSLLYTGAAASNLGDRLLAFHCARGGESSIPSASTSPQNAMDEAHHRVTQPDLPGQQQSWGLADTEIEEISLQEPSDRIFLDSISPLAPHEADEPSLLKGTGFVAEGLEIEHLTTANDVLVIVPTRSRPAECSAFVEEFFATSTRSDLLFALDEDDPLLGYYTGIPGVLYEVNPRLHRVGTLNLVANKYLDRYPYLAVMSDLHRIRTPGWDQQLVEAIAGVPSGIAYGSDLQDGEALPHAVLMHADIVRTLGFIAPPVLIHHGTDAFWHDLGQALGSLRYCEDVVIAHHGALSPRDDADATAPRPSSLDIRATDLAAYARYARSRLEFDITRLDQGDGCFPGHHRGDPVRSREVQRRGQ